MSGPPFKPLRHLPFWIGLWALAVLGGDDPRARQEAERGHLEHVQGAAAVRQLPAEVQAVSSS